MAYSSNGKKERKILFVCVKNACRSQMAEAFINRLAEGEVKGVSAGIEPAAEVNPIAVKVMDEVGVNISSQKPKLLTREMVEGAYKVIPMGCGADACPILPKGTEGWTIEDPPGKTVEKFRDEIKRKVENLIRKYREAR